MGERHDDDTVCCLGSQKASWKWEFVLALTEQPTVLPPPCPRFPTRKRCTVGFATGRFLNLSEKKLWDCTVIQYSFKILCYVLSVLCVGLNKYFTFKIFQILFPHLLITLIWQYRLCFLSCSFLCLLGMHGETVWHFGKIIIQTLKPFCSMKTWDDSRMNHSSQ